MTISSTSTKVTLSGNGSTTVFAYNFLVLAASELKVYVRTNATGAESLRAAGTGSTNYAITGVGAASGGNVTFVTAPTAAESVILIRETGLTQSTDYVENSAFQAEDHETALDRLTMISQEQQEELDRSFKVSRTTSITTPEFVDDAAARADKVLAFSADGNSIEAVTGRVNTVTASTVTPTAGAAGSGTASFTASTGALALGIPQGSTGHAGISMQYSTTTTDADPGAGFVRLNNTSLNSATIMYVDDSDGTTDISGWVQSWDNSSSGSKGFITIAGNPNSASPLVIFKVNGTVTDASGYTKIPVAYVSGSTSISNSAEISVQFSPAGDGDVAGLDYTFSTTTTDSDPGTGALRLNHGTIGSATAIYIDDSDANSADISAYLLTWDDSTNTADRGQIYITKKSAPANFAIFKVSGASTDASGYVKLAVTHVSSSGSFSNADPIAVEFNRTGNAGDMTDPLTTRGDIIARSASAPARLAIGGANTVLTSDGTDPAWSTNVTVAGKLGVAGDTAAGDNAAIGYTAAEGLILTGQGSTNDVTIKNDADADVIEIPTGTTNVTVAGQLNGGTIILAETDTDTSNTGSVTIDFSAHQNFVLTLTGNVTLANPSTESVGQAGVFVFIQDGTGSRTLSLGTDYETAASGGITLSTAAAAVDVVPYFVKASGSIQLGAPQLAFG